LKDSKVPLKTEDGEEIKKKKLIINFVKVTHPDKHTDKEPHIRLLYREITKILNELLIFYK